MSHQIRVGQSTFGSIKLWCHDCDWVYLMAGNSTLEAVHQAAKTHPDPELVLPEGVLAKGCFKLTYSEWSIFSETAIVAKMVDVQDEMIFIGGKRITLTAEPESLEDGLVYTWEIRAA